MCSQECVLYLMVSFCIVWVFLAGDKTKTYPNKQQQGKKHLSLYTGSVFSMSWILCCSVTQSCPTLKDLMDFMTAGFPVHHDLSELAQTRVHWVGDAIQPSLPLSSPSPPTFNPSQNQVFSNMSVLRMRCLKYWSFSVNINTSMNTQDWSPLGWTCWISLQPKGLSKVFSNTTVQKHHFFCAHVSLQSNSYIHTWPLDKA